MPGMDGREIRLFFDPCHYCASLFFLSKYALSSFNSRSLMIIASFIDSASLRSFFSSDSSMDNLAAIEAAHVVPSWVLLR
jgi:hypothetical protein